MSESNAAGVGGKIGLGCGALSLLASVGVCLFGAFHVFLDPHGHISADEAAPALVGGIFCSLVSVVLAAIGAYFGFKKPSPSAASGSSAPFPLHLVSGCASLLAIVLSCSAFGAAFYGFDRADYYEDRASEERVRQQSGYDSWGLGPYYYESQADDARSVGIGGICCGLTGLAMFLAGVLGAVVLRRRRAAKIAEASSSASEAKSGGPNDEPPPSAPGGYGSPPQGPPPPGGAFGSG